MKVVLGCAQTGRGTLRSRECGILRSWARLHPKAKTFGVGGVSSFTATIHPVGYSFFLFWGYRITLRVRQPTY